MLVIKALVFIYLQNMIGVHSTGLFGFVYGFPRVCLCRCGISRANSGNNRSGRAPKISSVVPHEYPWLAAIHVGPQLVTGSLISDRHVLTAASPFYGVTPENIIVTLGAHDRCVAGGSALNVTVQSTIIHPGYSQTSQDSDLALVVLKHAVTFSQYISPICLPGFGGRNREEQLSWTSGWSQNNSSCTPHVVVLPTLPAATCLDDTNKKGCLGPLRVKSVLCKSDVGSPVMTRWSSMAAFRLIGVVSSSSCDDTSTAPPMFTRISDHLDWIYEYIRRDCVCL